MPYRSRLSLASAMTTSSSNHVEKDAPARGTTGAATPQDDDEEGLPPPVQADYPDRRPKKKTRISLGLHVRWDRFLRKLGSGTAPSTSSALDESSGDSTGYNRSRGGAAGMDEEEEVDEVVVDREWSGEIKSSVHSDHGGSPEKSHGSNPQLGHGGTSTDRDSLAIHADGCWANYTLLIWLRYRIWPAAYGFFYTHFLDEKSENHYRKENWFLRKSLALWAAGFYIVNWALAVAFTPKHPGDLADIIFFYGISPALTFPLFFMVVYDFPRDRPVLYQIYLACSTWMWSIYQIVFIFWCGFYTNGVASPINCEGKDFLTTFYYTSAMQTIALFGLSLNRFPAMVGIVVFTALSFGLVVPQKTSFVRNVINFIIFQSFLLYIHYMRENAERRLYTLRDQLKIQFRATQKAQVNERKASDSKRRLTSYVFHEVRVPLNTALLAVQNMEASGTIARTQDIEFKALEGSLSMMSKVLNDVLDFNRMDSGRFESVLKPYAFHQVMRSLFIPLRLATDARGLEFVTDFDRNINGVARKALLEARGESAEAIAKQLFENPDEDGIVVGDETRLRQIITNLASNACKFTPAGGKLMITTKLVIPNLQPSEDEKEPEEIEKEHRDISSPGITEKGSSFDVPSTTAAGSERPGEFSVPRPLCFVRPADNVSDIMDEKHSETRSDRRRPGLSRSLLSQHDVMYSKPTPLEWIVVRIEVTDTGCGIRPKDMVQTKLFSAFNQTEMGRQQGGKGTGLGLALVRQIVKRSGGRLGVRSKVNEGSTFWVELPLGVGSKVAAGLSTPDAGKFYSELSTPGDRPDCGSPRVSMSTRSSLPVLSPIPSPQTEPFRSSSVSVLHGIMDQGGMVEISTKKDGHGRPPTRTIGDPSTGTEPTRTRSLLTGGTSSPEPQTPPERSAPLTEESPDPTIKPTRLELPKPSNFVIEEHMRETTSVNGNAGAVAQGLTPGSTMSSGSASTLVGSSAQFESGMRVLVVDDDPLTRKLMSRMLTRLGCKVTTAENGEIALDLILNPAARPTPSSEDTGSSGLVSNDGQLTTDERYAVVFLDNQMPVMSGLEAVAKLRRRGRKDFVVGVTGNALLTDQQEYLDAGVDHVLTKPVLEKSLKAMLAIADERRKRGTHIHERSMSPSS
ncbi:uncharacterized protein PHACADRAFT_188239 [Phanerochaete carnosa HHB-10118-sp]|uniref:histidine kinase n=1 Tax=Phanerochaete carnosa (strain HHB-10118-sp) TaxID=650164 RepID=K5VVU4_PHACS|nr:uncharacterized protein PHACADRAFT_188239 [Phanerochaete carnosa HHB-10118-sp]EKM50704.1 hypothetical protein PHACADRAFT_188239 [Phanerochaete carnosa HHB-10118-sp]